MILMAVSLNNPKDQPGKIELAFNDQKTCEQVLSTMKYELKLSSFKIEGKCLKTYETK
jgi:hypothetical protein